MGSKEGKVETIEMPIKALCINGSRLILVEEAALEVDVKYYAIAQIKPFRESHIQSMDEDNPNLFIRRFYFEQMEQLQIFLSNLMCVKQLTELKLFDELQISTQKTLFVQTRLLVQVTPKQLNRMELRNNPLKLIDLLIFLAECFERTKHLMIRPQSVICCGGKFFLTRIQSTRVKKLSIVIAFVHWVNQEEQDFEGSLGVNLLKNCPPLCPTIKQICETLMTQKIQERQYRPYLERVKQKAIDLRMRMDSFALCSIYKRFKMIRDKDEWILAKKFNEVCFYNVMDKHCCIGKIVRKKRCVNIEKCCLVFDSADLQVKFSIEESSMIVRANQFELEDYSSISDIELKHKMPFKMDNPHMFQNESNIYLLEQFVYKYDTTKNKVTQMTKKLYDSIFLAASAEHSFIVIRASNDIFKHGLKIYIKDEFQVFRAAGVEDDSQISSIRIDIRHVQFCTEVYRGVYVMLAHKNIWILDLFAKVFFSYAPLEQVKAYIRAKDAQNQQFMFQIYSQPFNACFLRNHQGVNVVIKDNILHTLGTINGKIYYLQYLFLFEGGALRLLKYQSLSASDQPLLSSSVMSKSSNDNFSEHHFNIYNEQLDLYINSHWVHTGPIFLEVFDFDFLYIKNSFQIFVRSQPILFSLKEEMEERKRNQMSLHRQYILMLLCKITLIFEYLHRNQIQHRNLSMSSLFVTEKREIKLIGWTEPQKAWYTSDFKDYLLVCFNIITQNNIEKLSDKIIQKNHQELREYPTISDKLIQAFKMSKVPEKKSDVDKSLSDIKQYLAAQLAADISGNKGLDCIFSFEFNTPRFSMVKISTQKIKKMQAVPEVPNPHNQFTFKDTDKYVWDEKERILYVLTISFQMLEIKIPIAENDKEEILVYEECEYLPKNLLDSTVICVPDSGLYSFGGIFKGKKGLICYNNQVYHFNRQRLTWETVCTLEEEQVNPRTAISACKQFVYLFGGSICLKKDFMKIHIFDIKAKTARFVVDKTIQNYLSSISNSFCSILQLNLELQMFLSWHIENSICYFKVFSTLICGFELNFQAKIFWDEQTTIKQISTTFEGCSVHFLKPYGKFCTVKLEGLDHLAIAYKTFYN